MTVAHVKRSPLDPYFADEKLNNIVYPALYAPRLSSNGLPQQWFLHKTKGGMTRSNLNISAGDGIRLNAISTRVGLRSGVVIHQSQDRESLPLAVARIHNRYFTVALPGKEGADTLPELKLKIDSWKSKSPRVTWQMLVGTNGYYEPEDFEWRGSNGSWKLIRHAQTGEEVVAVWNVNFTSTRLSGEFQFLKSGATGELGAAFTYVASVSALAIGKLLRDTLNAHMDSMAGGYAAVVAGSHEMAELPI